VVIVSSLKSQNEKPQARQSAKLTGCAARGAHAAGRVHEAAGQRMALAAAPRAPKRLDSHPPIAALRQPPAHSGSARAAGCSAAAAARPGRPAGWPGPRLRGGALSAPPCAVACSCGSSCISATSKASLQVLQVEDSFLRYG
jgi:hypothetical protein